MQMVMKTSNAIIKVE